MAFIRALDPKLVSTLVTAIIARLALELGVAEDDPLLQSAIALVVAAVVGFLTPNEGSVLRTVHDDGNPKIPEGLRADQGYSLVETVLVVFVIVVILVVLVRYV